MNCKSILALFSSLLLVCAPMAEAADMRGIAVLSSAGKAQVNGIVVPTGTTIFSGDYIVNLEATNIALALTNGGRLILAGSGSVRMAGSKDQATIMLENGKLAVLTHAGRPVSVEAAGTRIAGGSGDAVYAAFVDGNNLQVIASKGDAEVEGAGRTISVPEGKTLLAAMAPPDTGGSQGGAPPGAVKRFFTFERVLLIVTTAAALTALGIAVNDLTRTCRIVPTSPQTVRCD